MKYLIMITALIISASSIASTSQYPQIDAKIVCLNVDENGTVLGDKKIEITKNLLSESNVDWGISELINGTPEYGGSLIEEQEEFQITSSIFNASIKIEEQTKKYFENKKQMEPFYIQYEYSSDFFEVTRNYRAKCLHFIF